LSSTRRSAKQVTAELANRLMNEADRGEAYYGAHQITSMIYTIELICAKMDWTDLARLIARWSCDTTQTIGDDEC